MVCITDIKNQRVKAVGEERGAEEALQIMEEGLEQGWFKASDIRIPDLWEAFTDGANLSNGREVHEAMTLKLFPKAASTWAIGAVQDGFKYGAGDAPKLVTEDTATAEDTPIVGFTAGDEPAQTPDGMPFEETDFVEKYSMVKSYVFGKILRVTRRAVKWDRTGQILNRAKAVGRKLGKHYGDFIVAKVADQSCIKYGEATDIAGTAHRHLGTRDATNHAVYLNSHAAIDGQTNDNLTADTLSWSNLASKFATFATFTDEVGDTIEGLEPTQILVPKSLKITASQIVHNLEWQHDIANRNVNVKEVYSMEILSHSKLDSYNTATWYIGNFPEQNWWLWEERPSVMFQGADSDAGFGRDVLWSWRYMYAGGGGANEYRWVIKNGS